jgi:hypothetical protein
MKMKTTTLLLNPQTYDNEFYDDDVEVFMEWAYNDSETVRCSSAGWVPWEHLYTFQLFVREARKDE